MERSVYFDGWYRDMYCFHPSLPMRRLQMIEDLEEFKSTVVVWSSLGGGSIALPYLEIEAYMKPNPRLRFYGYLSDREFIEECTKRGIKVFGVIFEAQAWEVPIETNEEEDELISFNFPRGEGKKGYFGIREFSQDRYPKLFKRFHEYFPHGIHNRQGEEVTNLLDEVVSRDINGNPIHTEWVEIKDWGHECYLPCRNNPVWREYIKKISELQIDAGVHGIQLDEPEGSIICAFYGGCFCKECREGFRGYLKRLKEEKKLPEELRQIDLGEFNYGEYLKKKGFTFREDKSRALFYKEYFEYQLHEAKNNFVEITSHIRTYAGKKGKDIIIGASNGDFRPVYIPQIPYADFIICEKTTDPYSRQANAYSLGVGLAKGKPLVAATAPTGELLELVKKNRGFDLLRLILIEAQVYGCSMSVPYGSWMGNKVKDALYVPKEAVLELREFFARHDALYSSRTGADVGVIYSFPSYYYWQANELSGKKESVAIDTFWHITELMGRKQILYDVIPFGDDDLLTDGLKSTDLSKYKVLILPDCCHLTERQLDILNGFMANKGYVIVIGRFAENSPRAKVEPVTRQDNFLRVNTEIDERVTSLINSCLPDGPQIITAPSDKIGVNFHLLSDTRTALHIINYGYDRMQDKVIPIEKLTLNVRTGHEIQEVLVYPFGKPDAMTEPRREDRRVVLELKDVPIYTIIVLSE